MKLVNLTERDIVMFGYDEEGSRKTLTVRAAARPVRVMHEETRIGEVTVLSDDQTTFSLPVCKHRLASVYFLPQPEEGTLFVVSREVLEATRGVRSDLVTPEFSHADKNKVGVVIGVWSLIQEYQAPLPRIRRMMRRIRRSVPMAHYVIPY